MRKRADQFALKDREECRSNKIVETEEMRSVEYEKKKEKKREKETGGIIIIASC